MKTSLILIGGGGHCISCIDVIGMVPEFLISGILDRPEKIAQTVNGVPIIGTDNDIDRLFSEQRSFFITIGFIKDVAPRVSLFERLTRQGIHPPVIISPHAYVSSSVKIGSGTIVMHAAVINASAVIGKNAIINTGAVVEHSATVGDHSHISTGAIVNGDCSIGDRVFVGSRSMISNNVRIIHDTIIGAGSVVLHSIETPGIYAGNPARMIS